jgi:hypothetical protein
MEGIMQADISLLTQTADFLIKYGFLAVGLCLIFVVAPMVYKVWKTKLITLGTVCFGIAFIIAFGALDLLQRYWPWLISSQRTMVTGVIRGIKNGSQVQIRSDSWRAGEAYTKREFDREKPGIYNFPFILVTADVPNCLAIGVSSTDQHSEDSSFFNLTRITSDDMANNLQIIAEVRPRQDTIGLDVWRERDEHRIGDPVTLPPLSDTETDCASHASRKSHTFFQWPLITSAFAQTLVGRSIDDLAVRLQSDDVFTRRDARIELSRQGTRAFKKISQLLDRNDYRLQLGAVVALDGMPDEQRKQAPAELLAKVRLLLNHPDKTMRKTASHALRAAVK